MLRELGIELDYNTGLADLSLSTYLMERFAELFDIG